MVKLMILVIVDVDGGVHYSFYDVYHYNENENDVMMNCNKIQVLVNLDVENLEVVKHFLLIICVLYLHYMQYYYVV